MSFTVNAFLTRSEFIRMSVRRTYTNPVILFFSCVGVAALGLGLLQLAHLVPPFGNIYPTLFIGVYFCLAFPAFNAWLAARTYRYGTLSSQHVVYTFSEEGLRLSTATDALPWEGIVRKQRIGKYLLLFTDRVSAFILPIDGFSAEGLAFVAAHVPKGRI
ncbi:YcxB family protein [Dinghuibacter silviterrae]|uniref:YcxB-like protein n=1 Tax=Dinghuibacter silviterrae TaxID=1539049 RepID=A0A4R8DVJ7_9BACT|nr:YcxB family protein [Dinghuibacter silviterrae]TDX02219.1 YcxB-like protein [Dinghuibacter silviterrae]